MEPKNSEYYMGNRDELPTILTLKNSNGVITYELPWDAGADEILNAVYSGMVGLTFDPDGILEAMQDFVNNHKKIDEGNYEDVHYEEEARITHKFNVDDKVKIINGPFSENTINGKILNVLYADQYKVLYKVAFLLLDKTKTNEDGTIPGTNMIEIINENDLKLDV